jgi:hypothetical protein
MKVKIFGLCDNAFFDQANKLCMIGIFDRVFAEKVPTGISKVALAGEIVGAPMSEEIELKVSLVDDKGKDALKPNLIKVRPSPSGSASFIINIGVLEFKKFGEYTFKLLKDKKVLMEFPLYISKPSKRNKMEA